MTTSDGDLPNYGSVPKPPADSSVPPPVPPVPPQSLGGPVPPTASPPRAPLNPKALWSLIIAVASLVGVCCVFGGFVGIAAIVLGVLGRAEVMKSNGAQSGVGLAIAGIVLGAIAEFGSIVMLLVLSVDSL